MGDFNGDGKPDVAVANGGDDTIYIYLGNGDKSLQLPTIIHLSGISPVGIRSADLRGDGKLDLIVSESDSQTVGILYGNGDGTFQPEIQISLPDIPLGLAIADFNRDGHEDVLVGVASTGGFPGRFAVFLNDGHGNLGAPIAAPPSITGAEGQEISVGDVNGDGNMDVLVTGADSANGSTVQIYLGNGDGTFTAGQIVDQAQIGPIQKDITNAVLADMNGDGCLDVIDLNTYGQFVLLKGDCHGKFESLSSFPTTYGIGDPSWGLAVADVNGDGFLDVIAGGVYFPLYPGFPVGSYTGNTVTVRLGDGTGHFGPASIYRGDVGMFSIATTSLTGTGKPDIITVNQESGTISIYSNDGQGGFGAPFGGYDGFVEGQIAFIANAPISDPMGVDIDGDGKLDLALLTDAEDASGAKHVTVMLNRGSGRFSPPIHSKVLTDTTEPTPRDFLFADFRKIGRPDFIALTAEPVHFAPQLIYAQNLGGGAFGPQQSVPLTTMNASAVGVLVAGDFNGDGQLDIAVAFSATVGSTFDELVILLGRGDGTFQQMSPAFFNTTASFDEPSAIFVGDANGDGRLDIFVWMSGGTNSDLYEFLGNGDGTLQPGRVVLPDLGQMAMIDVNHDHRLDVVEFSGGLLVGDTTSVSPLVTVRLGTADGGFGPAVNYSPYQGVYFPGFGGRPGIANGPTAPYLGDFNGDGNIDLAVIQTPYGFGGLVENTFVQFLMGNSDGTFQPTFDVFDMRVPLSPDLAIYNLLGDNRSSFVQSTSFTASYQLLPSTNAPSFQMENTESPVLGGQDSFQITLDLPAVSNTVISLSASDPGVQIPSTATVPAGETSVQIPYALANTVPADRWFSITGVLGNTTQTVYNYIGNTATDNFDLILSPPPPLDSTFYPGTFSFQWTAGIESFGAAASAFDFSCSGMPAGTNCDFQFGLTQVEIPASGSGGVHFRIFAAETVAPATYNFTMLASDGVRTLSVPGQFTVIPAPPALQISTTSLNFGEVLVGTNSPPLQINITNTSSATATIQQVVDPLPVSTGSFQVTNDCPQSLPANGACTIKIIYASAQPGNATGDLTILSSSSLPVIHLSAISSDFILQTAPGSPNKVTVLAGQTAQYQLTAASSLFDGSIGLACTGAPALSSCSVSPTSTALTSGGTAPLAVKITTTGPNMAAVVQSTLIWRTNLKILLLFAAALWSYVGLRAWGKRFVRLTKIAGFTAVLSAALCLLTLSGCGGGSSSPGSGGGGTVASRTPAGNYSIQVTGTSGGGTRNVTLILTVQ